jgi:CRP-like cAMP-binding protein
MDQHQTLLCYLTQISPLGDDDLAQLAACAISCQLKKGDTLLREGEICRSFYLVEKGHLRTYYNKDGVLINLNFTFEGEFAANLKSFKSRQPSEWFIEAGEDTSVWIFNFNDQISLSGDHIILFFRRLAVRMLLAAETHSNLFKIYTPAERYSYIEKNNPRLLQRVPLTQIASYLGVARETLSRIRAKTL